MAWAPEVPKQVHWEDHWTGVLQTGKKLTIGRKSSALGGTFKYVVGPTGSFKKGDTFSYDSAGWVAAWTRFETGDPDGAKAFRERWPEDSDSPRVRLEARRAQLRILESSSFVDADFVLITGFNLGIFTPGDSGLLIFAPDRLVIADTLTADVLLETPYSQLEAVTVLGAGLVVTGGGFIGGGEGLMGSLEGMAIAAALNHFTTKASVENLVEIRGSNFHQVWLNTDLAPPALKLSVMPVQAQVGRGISRSTVPEQLALLHDLHRAGALTDDEFERAKAHVLPS